jgi:hypothetical protein
MLYYFEQFYYHYLEPSLQAILKVDLSLGEYTKKGLVSQALVKIFIKLVNIIIT